MLKLSFSELTEANLKSIAKIQEKGIVPDKWNQMMLPCTDQDRERVQIFTSYLLNYQVVLMNEATIWSRAIYPLLMLAESGHIQAWAGIPLEARYPCFELAGTVDGILGNSISGRVDVPYLVVLETKRGIEAKDPRFQLYGEMLAAAWLNWQQDHETTQEIFGCYTVSDSWTFVHGIVQDFEAEHPVMTVELSREYAERIEAETILQILKFIVAKYANEDGPSSRA